MDIPNPLPGCSHMKVETITEVIDLDEVTTAADLVYEWDIGIRTKFKRFSIAENSESLDALMQWYIESLKERASNLKDFHTLKSAMFKHMYYFKLNFAYLNSCFVNSCDCYFDKMEEILSFYCFVESKTLPKKFGTRKRFFKVAVNDTQNRIVSLLRFYLSNKEDRMNHVLMLTNLDLTLEESKDLLNILYGNFLTKEPKDKSDIAFCRSFILYQKWKKIRRLDEWEKMDEVMYSLFDRTPRCMGTSCLLRKLLSSVVGCDVNRAITDYFEHSRSERVVSPMDVDIEHVGLGGLNLESGSNFLLDEEYDESFDREFNNFKREMAEVSRGQPQEPYEEEEYSSSRNDCQIVSVSAVGVDPNTIEIVHEILEDDDICEILNFKKKMLMPDSSFQNVSKTAPIEKSFLDSIEIPEMALENELDCSLPLNNHERQDTSMESTSLFLDKQSLPVEARFMENIDETLTSNTSFCTSGNFPIGMKCLETDNTKNCDLVSDQIADKSVNLEAAPQIMSRLSEEASNDSEIVNLNTLKEITFNAMPRSTTTLLESPTMPKNATNEIASSERISNNFLGCIPTAVTSHESEGLMFLESAMSLQGTPIECTTNGRTLNNGAVSSDGLTLIGSAALLGNTSALSETDGRTSNGGMMLCATPTFDGSTLLKSAPAENTTIEATLNGDANTGLNEYQAILLEGTMSLEDSSMNPSTSHGNAMSSLSAMTGNLIPCGSRATMETAIAPETAGKVSIETQTEEYCPKHGIGALCQCDIVPPMVGNILEHDNVYKSYYTEGIITPPADRPLDEHNIRSTNTGVYLDVIFNQCIPPDQILKSKRSPERSSDEGSGSPSSKEKDLSDGSPSSKEKDLADEWKLFRDFDVFEVSPEKYSRERNGDGSPDKSISDDLAVSPICVETGLSSIICHIPLDEVKIEGEEVITDRREELQEDLFENSLEHNTSLVPRSEDDLLLDNRVLLEEEGLNLNYPGSSRLIPDTMFTEEIVETSNADSSFSLHQRETGQKVAGIEANSSQICENSKWSDVMTFGGGLDNDFTKSDHSGYARSPGDSFWKKPSTETENKFIYATQRKLEEVSLLEDRSKLDGDSQDLWRRMKETHNLEDLFNGPVFDLFEKGSEKGTSSSTNTSPPFEDMDDFRMYYEETAKEWDDNDNEGETAQLPELFPEENCFGEPLPKKKKPNPTESCSGKNHVAFLDPAVDSKKYLKLWNMTSENACFEGTPNVVVNQLRPDEINQWAAISKIARSARPEPPKPQPVYRVNYKTKDGPSEEVEVKVDWQSGKSKRKGKAQGKTIGGDGSPHDLNKVTTESNNETVLNPSSEVPLPLNCTVAVKFDNNLLGNCGKISKKEDIAQEKETPIDDESESSNVLNEFQKFMDRSEYKVVVYDKVRAPDLAEVDTEVQLPAPVPDVEEYSRTLKMGSFDSVSASKLAEDLEELIRLTERVSPAFDDPPSPERCSPEPDSISDAISEPVPETMSSIDTANNQLSMLSSSSRVKIEQIQQSALVKKEETKESTKSPLIEIDEIKEAPLVKIEEIHKVPLVEADSTYKEPVVEAEKIIKEIKGIQEEPLIETENIYLERRIETEKIIEAAEALVEMNKIIKTRLVKTGEIRKVSVIETPSVQTGEILETPFIQTEEILETPFVQTEGILETPFVQTEEILETPFVQTEEIHEASYAEKKEIHNSFYGEIKEIQETIPIETKEIQEGPYVATEEIHATHINEADEVQQAPHIETEEVQETSYVEVEKIQRYDKTEEIQKSTVETVEIREESYVEMKDIQKTIRIEAEKIQEMPVLEAEQIHKAPILEVEETWETKVVDESKDFREMPVIVRADEMPQEAFVNEMIVETYEHDPNGIYEDEKIVLTNEIPEIDVNMNETSFSCIKNGYLEGSYDTDDSVGGYNLRKRLEVTPLVAEKTRRKKSHKSSRRRSKSERSCSKRSLKVSSVVDSVYTEEVRPADYTSQVTAEKYYVKPKQNIPYEARTPLQDLASPNIDRMPKIKKIEELCKSNTVKARDIIRKVLVTQDKAPIKAMQENKTEFLKSSPAYGSNALFDAKSQEIYRAATKNVIEYDGVKNLSIKPSKPPTLEQMEALDMKVHEKYKEFAKEYTKGYLKEYQIECKDEKYLYPSDSYEDILKDVEANHYYNNNPLYKPTSLYKDRMQEIQACYYAKLQRAYESGYKESSLEKLASKELTAKVEGTVIEMASLPYKKRKYSTLMTKEEEDEYYIDPDTREEIIKRAREEKLDKEISYPARPMLSIADIPEAIAKGCVQAQPSCRPFKTPAEKKEMLPLPTPTADPIQTPVANPTNAVPVVMAPAAPVAVAPPVGAYPATPVPEQPRIVTEQYNNHTYNNPTINYHMNHVPYHFVAGVHYFPSILLPLNAYANAPQGGATMNLVTQAAGPQANLADVVRQGAQQQPQQQQQQPRNDAGVVITETGHATTVLHLQQHQIQNQQQLQQQQMHQQQMQQQIQPQQLHHQHLMQQQQMQQQQMQLFEQQFKQKQLQQTHEHTVLAPPPAVVNTVDDGISKNAPKRKGRRKKK